MRGPQQPHPALERGAAAVRPRRRRGGTRAGDCTALGQALARARGALLNLPPSVDDRLVTRLRQGIANLEAIAPAQCAAQQTQTDTVPTPTPTVPETTATEPTPTDTTPTTPTETTPTETEPPPTTTEPDGGEGGAGGETPEGGEGE